MTSTAGAKRQRVSLTKLQRESAAGLELISVCQAAGEDGVLSDDEITDLQGWVASYANAPFPAHAYLDTVVRRVLADGIITAEERREIADAVEKVLPPDLRSLVAARRRAAEERLALENAPLECWDFMVAGCRYEGRPAAIEVHADAGDRVYLVRDRDNSHSRNAVLCVLDGGHELGFVPERDARDLAPLLDAGHPYRAEIKKILAGGRVPIPVVIADLYPKDSRREGLTSASESPTRIARAGGCSVITATLAVLAGATWATLA